MSAIWPSLTTASKKCDQIEHLPTQAVETAAPLDLSLYKAALIVLAAAAIVIPLFHRLRVSSVLGFILVGIVVGPFGLASLAPSLPWLSAISIGEPGTIEPIANLGVVLLLFMIGLELSFERLVVIVGWCSASAHCNSFCAAAR